MGRIDGDRFEAQPLALLVGPQCARVNIQVYKTLKAIRVDFHPGGMYRMLGVPMHELLDGGFDASLFFDNEIGSVAEQLRNVSDLEDGKNVVEKFLLNQLRRCKSKLPFDSAMRVLMKHDGNLSMEQVASLSCLSIKQFERKCKERIGMNPKTYARVLKFSKAYRLHEVFPEMSWTAIAHQAGYYDQMHMIRDFRVFAGVNPSIIQQQLLATPLRMQKDLHY
jgi:AraC-like DNA-binding protein